MQDQTWVSCTAGRVFTILLLMNIEIVSSLFLLKTVKVLKHFFLGLPW